MKREELETYYKMFSKEDGDFYHKDEADSVMDAMEKRIKELEQALDMASDPALHPTCADCDKCSVVISKMETTKEK